jgi:succinate---hydroxymethylglutarate CoA-transferase
MTERPLNGVRVVEFGHVFAGPFAGMLLADLGADVVKVEPPSGDQMRGWPPHAHDEDGTSFSHNFASLNRNKRSVVADLKDPTELRAIRDLCLKADVLVENYRPSALDRFSLGFQDLAPEHRGLVYCSISGFGLRGPYSDRGAYDVVIQAMSGLMSVTGSTDGDPVKCGTPVADFAAALYAALTIVALLPQVRETGTSLHVDCSMLDCLLATSALQTSEYWGTGVAPRRLGSAHPRNAPYQAFAAEDGSFALAAGSDRLWWEVCEATGQPQLRDDPRFQTQTLRAANQVELAAILQPIFARKTIDHWLVEFERRGVPCGPVNTFADILADRHVHDRNLVAQIDVPVAGMTPTVIYPARVTGIEARLDRSPPRLGEHTREVLDDWGVAQ